MSHPGPVFFAPPLFPPPVFVSPFSIWQPCFGWCGVHFVPLIIYSGSRGEGEAKDKKVIVRILAPVFGETWKVGEQRKIQIKLFDGPWENIRVSIVSEKVDTAGLEVFTGGKRDGDKTEFFSAAKGDGASIEWVVPEIGAGKYRVQVETWKDKYEVREVYLGDTFSISVK